MRMKFDVHKFIVLSVLWTGFVLVLFEQIKDIYPPFRGLSN